MKVLNFGSLNIDYVYSLDHIVIKGETISSSALNTYPGGKGLNQSIAFGKAGAEIYHAGAIGKEGLFLKDFLKESGVSTEYISVLEEMKSGHAIIQTDKNGENCILLFGGANQAITKDQVDETLSHFEKGDYIILQNEINEMPYIMEKAAEKGMVIVLNPSPMDEKIKTLPLEKVNYFLLNEVEAAQILGMEDAKMDVEAVKKGLLETFPEAKVVLTLGGDGSVYLDKEQTVEQPIYKVDVVDTTAAGDTFTGYFIAGMLQDMPVKEAMDQAAKASAIAVSRPGAGVSIPTKEEVQHAFVL